MKLPKSILAALWGTFFISACNITENPTSETPDTTEKVVVKPAAEIGEPIYANRVVFPERQEWKTDHFRQTNATNGDLTYFMLVPIAQLASAKCRLPLDFYYLKQARNVGSRAIFRNKEDREARSKAFFDDFEKRYGPLSDDRICNVIERNKQEKTLLGALFY
ncbi:MAG: hypothetical protein ABJQ70_21330 [Roseobacter sp.]